MNVKVNAVECPKCGYIIYSRARHDFRTCNCGAVSIDGGFDYWKIGCAEELCDSITSHEIELPLTKKELYDDWNHNQNKYGSIEPCGPPLSSASYAS